MAPLMSTSLRRIPGQLRHRLSQAFGSPSPSGGGGGGIAASNAAADITVQRGGRTAAGTAGRVRPRPRRSAARPPTQFYPPPTTTGIDIARFGLLSVATLPFTIWIAYFTYDYVYRVEICQEALGRQDDELRSSDTGTGRHAGDDNTGKEKKKQKKKDNVAAGTLLGRDKELAEVSSLLDQEPSQIIVIAGGNEAGKSKFVSELLQGQRLSSNRGVTYVQLAQLVDSVSSFTQVLVHAFDLRWFRLRHALVDVLPFAGSEILVMKERFGDRDLAQALVVVTDALKRNAASTAQSSKPRPVIVIDGLGEGPGRWMSSPEGQLLAQRFLQWCIYVTKERRLAHVVLTGNEQLVLSLTDQNRITRGHVKVVGLGDLGLDDAAQIIWMELPDATEDEIGRITGVFGGFIHDVKGASRDIQYRLAQGGEESTLVGGNKRKMVVEEVIKARFQQQVERVIAAFSRGKEKDDTSHAWDAGGAPDEDNGMDPYLDPLKSIYSEAQAAGQTSSRGSDESDNAGWTQLQLWKTLQRLVVSPQMSVSFSGLRDELYNGDKSPILELMEDDVLGFQVDRSSDGGWHWKVTPASPALGKAFVHLVDDSGLKERFHQIEMAEEHTEQRREFELERARLYRDRKDLDLRKKSLMRTVELGRELGRDELARTTLAVSFEAIVAEEQAQAEQDRILRQKLASLAGEDSVLGDKKGTNIMQRDTTITSEDPSSLRLLLKDAVLKIVSGEGAGADKFSRLKRAFEALDSTNDGTISAGDLARVIKATTGREVDMDAANSLVEEWDLNSDRTLDYNELVLMLLADGNNDGKNRKRRSNPENEGAEGDPMISALAGEIEAGLVDVVKPASSTGGS